MLLLGCLRSVWKGAGAGLTWWVLLQVLGELGKQGKHERSVCFQEQVEA
jgi:hypothetical protein